MHTDSMRPNIEANPEVALCEQYEGKSVLFDPATGTGFELNEPGVLVWKHLDGRHSVPEIIGEIQREFHEVPDGVVKDVENLIELLLAQGLAGCVFPLRQHPRGSSL